MTRVSTALPYSKFSRHRSGFFHKTVHVTSEEDIVIFGQVPCLVLRIFRGKYHSTNIPCSFSRKPGDGQWLREKSQFQRHGLTLPYGNKINEIDTLTVGKPQLHLLSYVDVKIMASLLGNEEHKVTVFDDRLSGMSLVRTKWTNKWKQEKSP
jgi:hypothetical protein